MLTTIGLAIVIPAQASQKEQFLTFGIITGMTLYVGHKCYRAIKKSTLLKEFRRQKQAQLEEQFHFNDCAICAKSCYRLYPNDILITQCCKNIICSQDFLHLQENARELYQKMQDPEWRRTYAARPDFNGWPLDVKESAICPYCRAHPFNADQFPIELLSPELVKTIPEEATKQYFEEEEKNIIKCINCHRKTDISEVRERQQDLRCPYCNTVLPK